MSKPLTPAEREVRRLYWQDAQSRGRSVECYPGDLLRLLAERDALVERVMKLEIIAMGDRPATLVLVRQERDALAAEVERLRKLYDDEVVSTRKALDFDVRHIRGLEKRLRTDEANGPDRVGKLLSNLSGYQEGRAAEAASRDRMKAERDALAANVERARDIVADLLTQRDTLAADKFSLEQCYALVSKDNLRLTTEVERLRLVNAMDCHECEAGKAREAQLVAEVDRLECMFERTHGVHHSWVAQVDKLAAERNDYEQKWYQANRNLHAAWAERATLAAEVEWLRQYARHHEGCNAAVDEAYPCRCGWDEPPGLPAVRDAMRNVGPLDEKKEP